MKTYNFCLLGFGNIGRALLRLLLVKKEELRERYGVEWQLTGIASRRIGWLADERGLDVEALLEDELPAPVVEAPVNIGEWLKAARADVLFELTSSDVWTGQPAIEHIRTALEYGADVVTANKGAIVHAYHELAALAQERGKRLHFDATVMAGAPIFSLFRESLPAVRVMRFRGLLNSTCNVIIGEMERGNSFEEAVQVAQGLGIAETDPTFDVDGWDAAVKICTIATVLMGTPLALKDVERVGIRELDQEQVQQARADGRPYKLVATVAQEIGEEEARVVASVKPELVGAGDPLGNVEGPSLVAHFEMDVLPGLTLTLHVPEGGTAGPDVTAYEVLADFLRNLSV